MSKEIVNTNRKLSNEIPATRLQQALPQQPSTQNFPTFGIQPRTSSAVHIGGHSATSSGGSTVITGPDLSSIKSSLKYDEPPLSSGRRIKVPNIVYRNTPGGGRRTSFDANASAPLAIDLNSGLSAWQTINEKMLPLFSSQGLKGSVEDINLLVIKWLSETSSLHIIHEDVSTLIKTGMVTISNKLSAAANDHFVSRMADVWAAFLGTVIPYFQACFLPLHGYLNRGGPQADKLDTRRMCLMAFRNYVVFPLRSKLEDAIARKTVLVENMDASLRIVQMLSILVSIPISDDKRKGVFNVLEAIRFILRSPE